MIKKTKKKKKKKKTKLKKQTNFLFLFDWQKKTIKPSVGMISSPILRSIPVDKKFTLKKAAVAITDHTTEMRLYGRKGCGRFPDLWLASIPKVIWCRYKDLREPWS